MTFDNPGEINGRVWRTRIRLGKQEKPNIVKSLKNGFWYCGVHVTQCDEKYVANHWNYKPNTASLDRTIYGRGKTPVDAYKTWLAVWAWVRKERPKSVPLPSNFRLTSEP